MEKISVSFGEFTTSTTFAPNCAVIKYTPNRTNAKTQYLCVSGCKSNDVADIVRPLLALFTAAAKVKNDFEVEFGKFIVDGQESDSGLKANLRCFNQFLSADTIYKTNKDGQLSKAVTTESDSFRYTSLNVTKTSRLLALRGGNLTAALDKTAKAIAKQCALRSLVIKTAETQENADGQAKSEKKSEKKSA